MDDGSTDRTAEIAHKSLAGLERAKVIELPSNLGKATALNAGIQAAGCDLIATIDADTRLEPGALEAAMATLTERDAGAVAFYLDVDHRFTLLGQLQRQEYVAALNFERAGQDEDRCDLHPARCGHIVPARLVDGSSVLPARGPRTPI